MQISNATDSHVDTAVCITLFTSGVSSRMQVLSPLHDPGQGPWDARLQRSRSIEDVPDGLAGVQKLALQVMRAASSIRKRPAVSAGTTHCETRVMHQGTSHTVQGCWRAVSERTRSFSAAARQKDLTPAAWHIFALAKLRMYREADTALNSLGDLESPQYTEESPEGAGPLQIVKLSLASNPVCRSLKRILQPHLTQENPCLSLHRCSFPQSCVLC